MFLPGKFAIEFEEDTEIVTMLLFVLRYQGSNEHGEDHEG